MRGRKGVMKTMREILFRGKRTDNGEWVQGYICRYGWIGKEKDYIIPDYTSALYTAEIDPKTISQYTGLTDKYDKKIFEGDIINVTPDTTNRLMEVRWNEETLSWELTDVGTPAFEINHIFNTIDLAELEVESCYGERISFIVGNVYDNPEMMEKIEEDHE